jgi:hypothetical protein
MLHCAVARHMQATPSNLRPFSYVDSACAFAYFNLAPDNFGGLQDQIEAALQLLETNRVVAIQRLQSIVLELLFTKFRGTFFHEWHHCLQTIFYPGRNEGRSSHFHILLPKLL